jgi:uncharacterized protein
MRRKIIGIDFDDCLFDCGTRMCEFHNEAYGTALRRDDVKSLQLEHAWDCTPEEVIRRVEEFYWTHHHDAMHPMDGAVDALSVLSRRFELALITARPEQVREITMEFVRRHIPLDFGHVHFLGQYSPEPRKKVSKGDFCRKLEVAVFIDDALHHAESVAKAGIPVLLFDAPWNRIETPKKVTRVFSWFEAQHLIEAMLL